jgi:DNA-binding CsgD family transcriptional regulator
MAELRAVIGPMPLVGRMGVLDRMVSRLSTPASAAFVLAGSAGVGKTRLASEVARAAASMGHATAQVVATRAASSVPFGAFAPLMPEIGGTSAGLLGLLRQATDAIVERAGRGRPLLLVVDDAHLLDDGSAALVHQLVREASCNLVASVRTPGPAPDPITTLWKDELADRLDIDALSEAEVEELVRSTLGGPLTGPGLRWMWNVSGGNPLYVRELLNGALSSGALHDDGGMWVLRLPLPTPARLTELLASKLDDLPVSTAEVVDLLAVGEPLDLTILETLVSTEALEDAERRDLVALRESGGRSEIGLSHPLYGEVRRHQMPKVRRRRLCAALAEALGATGSHRPEDELRIARWQLEAGVRGDAHLFARAAVSARNRFDMELAGRLARAAIDAGAGVEAGMALAESEFLSGHHEEGEKVLAGLVPLCRTDDDRSRVANARAYNLGTLMGDRQGAADVIESALMTMTEPSPRFRLVARRASDNVYYGAARSALADATEILESDDDTLVARASYVASVALATLGRGDEAVACAYRGIELQRRIGDATRLPEALLVGAILGHAASGRLAAAAADARVGYHAGLESGDRDAVAGFSLLGAMVHVEVGAMAAASSLFREGIAVNRELRDMAPLRWCIAGTALAEGMAGNGDAAVAAIAELDALPPHWMTLLDPEFVVRGRAWAKVATGELSGARAVLDEGADRAAADGHPIAEARLLHDLVRLGERGAVAGRLANLAAGVEGDLVKAFADHAAAAARDSGPDLEASASAFETLGAFGLGAEAARAAAAAFRDDGLLRRASASLHQAEELERRCGTASGNAGGGGGGVGGHTGQGAGRLTRREREVAGMAASGASSREIADKLFLSARTVDNHLLRVYTKLGISSRDELAAALGRD